MFYLRHSFAHDEHVCRSREPLGAFDKCLRVDSEEEYFYLCDYLIIKGFLIHNKRPAPIQITSYLYEHGFTSTSTFAALFG